WHSVAMQIVEEGPDSLKVYEAISIAFQVTEKVKLDRLIDTNGAEITVVSTVPYLKDYDACEEDRPTVLAQRFNFATWGILAAFDGDARLGGAILAWNDPDYSLLNGRLDLAAIVDIRVHPEARGTGVGSLLIKSAKSWAKQRGCIE